VADRSREAPGETGDSPGTGSLADRQDTISAGAAFLARLKTLGVDYVFANSGTDFPPIIEGIAEAERTGLDLPETVIAPHEGAAMAMAHGYYLATGAAQAVFVHTNVGLSNAVIGAINAATENVPLLLVSGRTPTTELGRFGSRTVPIGWGQEMRDQHALVRETAKWDYELRFPEQVYDLADRGHAIACSMPKGPVYLSLPREVLCERVPAAPGARPPAMRPASPVPAAADIERAADLLAEAERPVIFAQRGAGGPDGWRRLGELATEWGIPVCQYWATQLALDTTDPMAAGPDPAPLLADADVVLVIDALTPWSPAQAEPLPSAMVIQLGPDPLQERFPVRNFRSDLTLAGETGDCLAALEDALERRLPAHVARNKARRQAVAERNAAGREARLAVARKQIDGPHLTKAAVSRILSDRLAGKPASVFSELGCQLPHLDLGDRLAWFDGPLSGGLGWGFPAAMGFKLAQPDRTVIATMGDGSYIFSNPVACHMIAEALDLSVVVVILNNAEWGAVRQSVLDVYPDGHAARSNRVPLTSLAPGADFVRIAEANRAWARRVSDRNSLETALDDAIAHTDAGRGLALIDVTIR
jgi:acetolactate synthase-1/2/3 large subunit